MKRGKEIKIDKYTNYRVSIGTVNVETNKSIYININAWANIVHKDDLDYNKILKGVRKKIKQTLFNVNQTHFNPNATIVDFDIRESGIRFGKLSFMSCEITLYQTKGLPIHNEFLITEIESILNSVIIDVLEKDIHFNFNKRKLELA